MILKAYAIYDRKGLLYHAPFFQVSDGAATRMLDDLVNDRQTTISRHPADYVLYLVGQFDDQNCLLSGMQPVQHIVDALALVAVNASLPLEKGEK